MLTWKTSCNDCSIHMNQCDLCQQLKREDEFTESAWLKRATRDQRTLCKDCCNPVCTASACKTCKICRDVGCKKSHQVYQHHQSVEC
eukprot:4001447-Karenia_brevis.AAC.1